MHTVAPIGGMAQRIGTWHFVGDDPQPLDGGTGRRYHDCWCGCAKTRHASVCRTEARNGSSSMGSVCFSDLASRRIGSRDRRGGKTKDQMVAHEVKGRIRVWKIGSSVIR